MIAALLALPLLAAPGPAAPLPLAPQRGGATGPATGPAAGAAAGAGAQEPQVPPIQEEGNYYVLNFAETTKDSVGIDLAQFVKLCQDATGRNFIITEQTKQELSQKSVTMYGAKRIPKEDFYRFFQILMFIYDFATVEVGPPHLSVTVIQNLQGQNRAGVQNIKQRATIVLPEDLDDFADQPAVLITTVIELPNTDVRQLTTSLRGLLTDNQTQNMLNAGTSNAIVLTGFGSNVAALAKLLFVVDEASRIPEEPDPVFEIIEVEYASAEEIADLIDQLLEAQQNALRNRPQQQPGAQGPGGALARGQVETKILTYSQTNALIVMALEEDLPRIKELVAKLDVEVIEPERNFHIYNLENVQADEISQTLDDFLQDAQRLETSTQATGGRPPGQSAGASSRSQNEVVVVPDPNTNSLLIAASKSRYQEVLELIRQLDRRQDQVLIETALIELTGSDFRDLGVELGLADIPAAGQEGGFGVTDFGLGTLVDTDNDQIPDSKVPNQASGITAGILDGGDFALPVLLRLFESRDNANVLNVPSVLVNNNGSARVEIKDSFPTTDVTGVGTGNNTTETFGDYVDAGITLEISPSIKASRYLRLNLTLNVSNFLGAVQGAIPPPKVERMLSTTVNVPDGDTMVIGGIITDTKRTSSERVPFLGSLPIIGQLFRRDSNSNDRTTLYFFVTPHILHDRDFADLAEISYRKKLSAAEFIGRDRLRVIDEDFIGDETDGVSLESFEVPLYVSPTRGEVDSSSVGLDPVRRARLMGGDQAPASAAPAVSEPAPEQPAEVEELVEPGESGESGALDMSDETTDDTPEDGR